MSKLSYYTKQAQKNARKLKADGLKENTDALLETLKTTLAICYVVPSPYDRLWNKNFKSLLEKDDYNNYKKGECALCLKQEFIIEC